ncbi:hypothetical protein SO802_018496 [Lithocarpus litseifolius]|uniref:Uncharacterized protein n=1 Tax=Lithocarpus litseifolius TaxID=425828 RepID=A0AAW2CM65_9ROSI
MATLGESSSAPPKSTDDKPVIVRVKRKTFQSPLDAFWEVKTKKVLVQHVETLSSSEKTIGIVQSFVVCMTVFNVLGNAMLEHEHAA